MGARLVRRLPDVPVLHGHPRAGGGARQPDPSLRARAEARVDRRRAHAADRGLGVRQAQRPQVPRTGTVRCAVGDLPVRRELHDLRREHRVDDGGRVLVLDRALGRVRLLRSARSRSSHRTPPRPRCRAAGAVRAVPSDRRDLRGGGHRRVVPPVRGPAPVQVAGDDVARRCPAHRVLGDAVLPAAPLPDRHGLRTAHRLREHAVPVHVEVGRRAVRARRDRAHRLDRPPAAHRHLARTHDADLRRMDRRVAPEHVLERAAHSLLLHLPLPTRRDRRRRDRAVARVDCGAARRARGQARCHAADASRRRGHLPRHPGHEPADPPRGPPGHQGGGRHGVQLARPREHEGGVRRRLGEVELRGIRGQARVRRVSRRHDDDGRRRQDERLWARRVGVRRAS